MSKNVYFYGLPSDCLSKKVKLSSYSISIPGFRTFLDPNQSRCKKGVWGSVMMVFLCISLFQIYERAQNFLSSPIYLDYKISHRDTVQYPSFTICPYNTFGSNKFLTEMEKQNVTSVYDLLSLPGYDLNKIWNMTEVNLAADLPFCKYQGESECNGIHFNLWRTQWTVLGICHTIDFPKRMGYYGLSSAFTLYTSCAINFPKAMKSKNHMVAIHNMYDDVTYAVLTNGYEVNDDSLMHINYLHNLKIYQNFTNRPCYSNEHLETCKRRCFDDHMLKISNCRLPFMKTWQDMRLCSTPEEFRQSYPIPVQEKLHFNEIEDCILNCGQTCERSTYDESVETKMYQFKINYVRIKVSPLRAGTVTMTETFSYSIVAFTCDVGAILGLYLGISVLSITEIIEFLIDVIKAKNIKDQ